MRHPASQAIPQELAGHFYLLARPTPRLRDRRLQAKDTLAHGRARHGKLVADGKPNVRSLPLAHAPTDRKAQFSPGRWWLHHPKSGPEPPQEVGDNPRPPP